MQYRYANELNTVVEAISEDGASRMIPAEDWNPEWVALEAGGAEIAAYVPPPGPPRRYSKRQLFGAMTDAEYDLFQQAEAQQSERKRAVFRHATELAENDADWSEFLALMTAAYGEARSAELLEAALL